MEKQKKHIVIIAGEASGDMHAAHLVDEIKKADPNVHISGLGGARMKQSGVEIYHDLTKIAVIGFWEVLKHYGEIKKIFDFIVKKIIDIKPSCVILVDYPGFNLRLAKKLKKNKIKVVYYISPQVWAWKKNRVHQVKKFVDRMLVIFEFEKEFYAKYNIDVQHVGHPLMDTVKVTQKKEAFLKAHGLKEYTTTIGILPGSRQKEIQRILPVMINAASILQKKFPMLQFLIVKAPTVDEELYKKQLKKTDLKIPLIKDDYYNSINASDLCMVTSGTATLETAILQKPMVVIYKTSFFTYILAKLFVKIPHIGLVNVVAQKCIVPECIQSQATGKRIASQLEVVFTDEIKIAQVKSDLAMIQRSLDAGGASQKAAEEVLKVCSSN